MADYREITKEPELDIATADRILQNVFREAGWKGSSLYDALERLEKRKEPHLTDWK
ncbi:hypothetical protein CE91St62_33800 [Lachnospiraceae bacterium]|uniref:hypothetical protein n=1 Tax=Extibacter sp. GGCC_0201 TaxID=2731209 RepID=UPI001AA14B96|nr:hypothetical protein [Extibacter sp. GGCC_0201]BDF34874.1 hypothetical protein CE91St61_29490 [Lachnospiraceae bacterium]MBO1722674.1 hypothetical protein [Extibacter sp. GGCC_0201]BDF35318.1 hypothetical protein CE91St61_33930 [Lachnospiraceae bacterium]BDF38875.1 hypothetical protein CE91St62_29360 [Lachnospiraceae bacterium]BDF39319.1 hypothetical protein CE91St62_33800 [Lachnospiraceae bacterium]